MTLLTDGRRRHQLKLAGCATYAVGDSQGQPVIVCLCCGRMSFNEHDIEKRYCSMCKEFHTEAKREGEEFDPAQVKPPVGLSVLIRLQNGGSAVSYWDGAMWRESQFQDWEFQANVEGWKYIT